MTEGKETELKLRLQDVKLINTILEDASLQERIVPDSLKTEKLEAYYYDTVDYSLMKAGLAYRVRREGKKWIATVKFGGTSGGGLHERREWNLVVPGPEPNLTPFYNTTAGQFILEAAGDRQMELLFITRFERKSCYLALPGGTRVELAIDTGEITTGDKKEAISELELELKRGNPVELLRLGALLAKNYPLFLESRSKFYRGLKLAGLTTGEEEECRVPELNGEENVKLGLYRVLLFNLQQTIKAQEDFLSNPEEPETIHQYRVRLGRLRSLISFCRPLFEEEYAERQDSLRQLSKEFAHLRKLDVLVEGWDKIAAGSLVSVQKQSWLRYTLDVQRRQERNKVIALVKSGQGTWVLLEFWAWIMSNLWCETEKTELKLVDYAGCRLVRWLKSIYKAGKELNAAEPVCLNDLWVRAKKLRYVLEELESILVNDTPKLITCLEKMQNDLRCIYNSYCNTRLLQNLVTGKTRPELYYEAGYLSGWQAFAAATARQGLNKSWRRFKKVAGCWMEHYREKEEKYRSQVVEVRAVKGELPAEKEQQFKKTELNTS